MHYKNALVDRDIEASSTNPVQEKAPLPIEFVLPPELESATSSIVPHESGAPDSEDEDQAVHMIVPAKVAAFLKKKFDLTASLG